MADMTQRLENIDKNNILKIIGQRLEEDIRSKNKRKWAKIL